MNSIGGFGRTFGFFDIGSLRLIIEPRIRALIRVEVAAMKHLPLRECGYAIAVVATFCLAYCGAYLTLVEFDEREDLLRAMRRIGDPHSLPEWSSPGWPAAYRIGGDWSKALFAPINELDRRIRPDYWEEPR
jgi:hypothetical protein